MSIQTRWATVEDFLAYLEGTRPLLEDVRFVALQLGDVETVETAEQLLTLYANDSALLRQLAERLRKPDGSVELGFSQEAFNILRAAGADFSDLGVIH